MNIANIQTTWKDSDEHKACSLGGLRCVVSESLQPNAVGVGSVEYCRAAHPWPSCDPYPDWLPWGRKIYKGDAPQGAMFYKPADVPKRFASAVMDAPPSGLWVASEPVEFVAEWRAYVVAGKVLASFCYSDFEIDYSPDFPWKIPDTVTAAVDFGLTVDRGIVPVEVNDPYAIGWYGRLSQYQIYTDFVVAGWQSMLAMHTAMKRDRLSGGSQATGF